MNPHLFHLFHSVLLINTENASKRICMNLWAFVHWKWLPMMWRTMYTAYRLHFSWLLLLLNRQMTPENFERNDTIWSALTPWAFLWIIDTKSLLSCSADDLITIRPTQKKQTPEDQKQRFLIAYKKLLINCAKKLHSPSSTLAFTGLSNWKNIELIQIQTKITAILQSSNQSIVKIHIFLRKLVECEIDDWIFTINFLIWSMNNHRNGQVIGIFK